MPFIRSRGGGGGGVVLTNAADFEVNNDQYFSFTPAGAGDDIKKGTVAVWLKREEVTIDLAYIWSAHETGDNDDVSHWRMDVIDRMFIQNVEVSRFSENESAASYAQTDYHHWMFVWDTTLATAADRFRIFRDGSEIALNSHGNGNPLQNEGTWWGTANPHTIGRNAAFNVDHYDGLMADFHYIDGLAMDVGDFVTFDGNNFTILDYAGSYGTNGFRLRFDNGANLGEDSSGNANDCTNNGVTQSSVVPTSPVS